MSSDEVRPACSMAAARCSSRVFWVQGCAFTSVRMASITTTNRRRASAEQADAVRSFTLAMEARTATHSACRWCRRRLVQRWTGEAGTCIEQHLLTTGTIEVPMCPWGQLGSPSLGSETARAAAPSQNYPELSAPRIIAGGRRRRHRPTTRKPL